LSYDLRACEATSYKLASCNVRLLSRELRARLVDDEFFPTCHPERSEATAETQSKDPTFLNPTRGVAEFSATGRGRSSLSKKKLGQSRAMNFPKKAFKMKPTYASRAFFRISTLSRLIF
jgi:hypothetical protein